MHARPPLPEISLPIQTLYADLVQRGLDAQFDQDFPEHGQFLLKSRGDRRYWYFQSADGDRRRQKYVGPETDPDLARRVEGFRHIKADAAERRQMVSALIAGGLPSTDPLSGDIIEALWRAGIFRLRGVLVGTAAFQTCSGLLGVRLPGEQMRTGDLDFAQFHGISLLVEDSLPPILEVLRGVDPTFRPVPHLEDPTRSTKFQNARRFEVEFLTPNRTSDAVAGRPAPMPALGGAGATPLRYLDFLLRQPVRAAVLHRAGIPVLVPAPHRFAVHKIIVCAKRRTDPEGLIKSAKDAAQAGALIRAHRQTRRAFEIGEAWAEAWERGEKWRAALLDGRTRLYDDERAVLTECIEVWAREVGQNPDRFGIAVVGQAPDTDVSDDP
ncbi:GSU2403 family nucleotidyltransferase fold protein [Rhodocista pekingensis]|uniref:GSU2403 family nucleotidyltransferase fold protein n=1 Tax=Rhodocista pekingensis TaxID=201185 RepID=A0ABW2KXW7_9PROT